MASQYSMIIKKYLLDISQVVMALLNAMLVLLLNKMGSVNFRTLHHNTFWYFHFSSLKYYLLFQILFDSTAWKGVKSREKHSACYESQGANPRRWGWSTAARNIHPRSIWKTISGTTFSIELLLIPSPSLLAHRASLPFIFKQGDKQPYLPSTLRQPTRVEHDATSATLT